LPKKNAGAKGISKTKEIIIKHIENVPKQQKMGSRKNCAFS
jgi:hypothetical protein